MGSFGDYSAQLSVLLAAPFVGSFIGVLIQRVPAMRPICFARSACEGCGHPLTSSELIPLVSYAIQHGRCRQCGGGIDRFHVEIELAAVAVAAVSALVGITTADVWITAWLGWMLLTLAWIDARHLFLPDVITLPLLIAGLLMAALRSPADIGGHMTGAGAGYIFLQGLAWSYSLIRRRSGIGAGDAKLLAAAGAWLGWAQLPWLVCIAAVIGLADAAVKLVRGQAVSAGTVLPFGPGLAGAFWLLWMLGLRG